jgi:chemosensory pili system protein ChpE
VLEVFTLALGVGLVFNAAPGAVFTESLRRGARGGFRPALAVQVGSLVGDAVWAVLGLTGVGVLFTVPALRVPLTVAGCLLLAWLGVQGIRAAVTVASPDEATAPDPDGRRGALGTGMAMSLANPWNVVYWSGAAGGVSGALGDRAGASALVVFFTGFMLASLVWCFVCAGAIAGLRRALPPVAVRGVELLCGLALLVFAALLLGRLSAA